MKEYLAVPDSVFDQPGDQALLEGVYDHVRHVFGDQFPTAKALEARDDIPECARNGWHLWYFEILVASNGIPDFLSNHCSSAEQLICAHRALKAVSAHELVVLLEAAIPLAKEASLEFGEFSEFPRHEWIDQFQVNPDWSNHQKIEKRSWELTGRPLEALAAKYLRAHRAEMQLKSKSRKAVSARQ